MEQASFSEVGIAQDLSAKASHPNLSWNARFWWAIFMQSADPSMVHGTIIVANCKRVCVVKDTLFKGAHVCLIPIARDIRKMRATEIIGSNAVLRRSY